METQYESGRRHHRQLLGRELSYREYPGTGTPLILLHGVGSSADGWHAAAIELSAEGAHVISIDLPGHGESSKEPGDYSLGSLASAIRDLLDLLDLTDVVLVGHSLGGGVSMQFLYQYPQYVRGMVLVSSGGLGTDANFALRLLSAPGAGVVMRMGLNPKTVGAIEKVKGRLQSLSGGVELISDKSIDRLRRLSSTEGRNSFLSTLRSVVDFSGQRVSALDKLHLSQSIPSLIIWGEEDSIIPVAHGRAAHELLPLSTFVVYPDVGHEPHRKDPERFAHTVQQWRYAWSLT